MEVLQPLGRLSLNLFGLRPENEVLVPVNSFNPMAHIICDMWWVSAAAVWIRHV